jgi:TatD DNase family protein
MRWFDHHCHIEAGAEGAATVAAALDGGVTRLVTVGTDVDRSREAIEVARSHAGTVWATAGVHPHDAAGADLAALRELLAAPEVVAVGECGLDFHYDHSPRGEQRDVFAAQIGLAHELSLPLVIHTRAAWEETFDVLVGEGVPERTVFHCFTGGADEAHRCLDLGAHLSFSGIVTFRNADDVRAAVRLCPDDRLLVETDSPYLAPVPHRGRPNQPAWVGVVGAAVAAERGRPVEEVAAAAWATTNRFYGLVG